MNIAAAAENAIGSGVTQNLATQLSPRGAQRQPDTQLCSARGDEVRTIGAVLGIIGALAATRMLGTVLYGVSATDPVSLVRGLAIVLAAIVMATLVPAWRAAKTNPLTALRHE